MLEELKIWIQHGFTRRPRKGARNILDVRWACKWKKVKDKTGPTNINRIIRMRMTLRGFKDTEAAGLVTFAGTASRVAQRIVVSEAACQGWSLTALDVKRAFLKGVPKRHFVCATVALRPLTPHAWTTHP